MQVSGIVKEVLKEMKIRKKLEALWNPKKLLNK